MMPISPEQLFCLKFQDLIEIRENKTARNLMICTAHLRLFYLEERPLVHLVAKKFDFQPVFSIRKDDGPDELLERESVVWAFNDPTSEIIRPERKHRVRLDEFLNYKWMKCNGKWHTVRESIQYVAYNFGVHYGGLTGKKKAMQDSFDKYSEMVTLSGLPVPIYAMGTIVEITIDTLKPLYDRIRI